MHASIKFCNEVNKLFTSELASYVAVAKVYATNHLAIKLVVCISYIRIHSSATYISSKYLPYNG